MKTKNNDNNNKIELRKIISLLRTEDYGFDLGKEIYISEKDVYKKVIKKLEVAS